MRKQLRAALLSSILASVRLDASVVELNFANVTNASFLGRRLAQSLMAAVTMRYPTTEDAEGLQSELDWNALRDELGLALQQDENLKGFEVSAISAVELSSVNVVCPANAAKPPGVTLMRPEDCACNPGFGYDEGACRACALGEYKSALSNERCVKCPEWTSTERAGATEPEECKCEAGRYGEDQCAHCPKGFYCPGSGKSVPCPFNSTTESGGSSSSADCKCLPGHQPSEPSDSPPCEPCQPGRYKRSVSNEKCFETCPSNANSPPASTEPGNCSCNEDHYAQLNDEDELDRCAPCTFNGLRCSGGFLQNGSHAQPEAKVGWYKTGKTLAVQCLVRDAAGASVCQGENRCAEGSTGWLCGECPAQWGRRGHLEFCRQCPDSSSAWLATSILLDLGRITSLNFIMAVLSAQGATKQMKLHTAILRIFQRWKDACSVLLSRDYVKVKLKVWSQRCGVTESLAIGVHRLLLPSGGRKRGENSGASTSPP